MNPATLRVSPLALPGQQTHGATVFPLAYQCDEVTNRDKVVGWVTVNRRHLIEQAADHGAVLFRRFPVATAEDFDAFVAAFDLPNFPYYESLSNAVRVNRTPRVFTANEAPPSVSIFLHHEMAQTPVYPSKLFFFCEQAAASGGATPLCRSDVLWERLAQRCPQFARDCQSKG